MSRRRAVITGIGPITCIGTGVDRFWYEQVLDKPDGVKERTEKHQIADRPIEKSKHACHNLAPVNYDLFACRIRHLTYIPVRPVSQPIINCQFVFLG